MDKRNKALSWLLSLAMLMILIAAALPIIGMSMHHFYDWWWAKYIYAAGAALAFIVRLLIKHDDSQPMRIKRLHRMENVSAMCYCISAFFLFYSGSGATDWLGFLTAGAALQAYSAFMIDYLEKKGKKRQ